MPESYRGLVFQRAVAETKAALSLNSGFIVRTVLVSLAGLALSWKYRPWDSTVSTVWSVTLGVIVANVVVIAVVLLVQGFRAPGLIHKEPQTDIERLLGQRVDLEAGAATSKKRLRSTAGRAFDGIAKGRAALHQE